MSKYKNCYISKSNVIALNIFYRLLTYGYVSIDDYDISIYKFRRYIGNIKYMLCDYFVYNISVVYDKLNNRYVLLKEGDI